MLTEKPASLRLYKHFFSRPDEPGLKRLLFEGDDVYMYVWINYGFQLDSFQIVWQERTVLSFTQPNRLKINAIGKEPFSRALSQGVGVPKARELKRLIEQFQSDLFPGLIDLIKFIVKGNSPSDLVINKQEKEIFKSLADG
jgi:hypothetical protein